MTHLGHRIREFFLLREAEEKSTIFAGGPLASMQAYHRAALRRIAAARDLKGSDLSPAALPLYREGCLLLALAFLASKGRELDSVTASFGETFGALEAALAESNLAAPPELGGAAKVLASPDLLEIDRWSSQRQWPKIEELDTAAQWLLGLVDVRSPRELKTTRRVRLGLAIASCLAVTIWAGVKVLSPKNYALGRPSSSSSVNYGTTPDGANDGSKSHQFEFHSAEEESPWWVVDMQKRVDVGLVKVVGRGDNCYDQSIPLALEVSDDGVSFRKVAERTEPFSDVNPWVFSTHDLSTRFIRLHTQRRSVLVLNEVEVYARKQN